MFFPHLSRIPFYFFFPSSFVFQFLSISLSALRSLRSDADFGSDPGGGGAAGGWRCSDASSTGNLPIASSRSPSVFTVLLPLSLEIWNRFEFCRSFPPQFKPFHLFFFFFLALIDCFSDVDCLCELDFDLFSSFLSEFMVWCCVWWMMR